MSSPVTSQLLEQEIMGNLNIFNPFSSIVQWMMTKHRKSSNFLHLLQLKSRGAMTQNYINHMKLNRFFWPKTQVAWLSRLIWMWLSILIHYYHQIHTHTLSAFRNVPRRHMLRSIWELLCMNLHLLRMLCDCNEVHCIAPLILVSVSVSARLHIETRLILILLWDVPIDYLNALQNIHSLPKNLKSKFYF